MTNRGLSEFNALLDNLAQQRKELENFFEPFRQVKIATENAFQPYRQHTQAIRNQLEVLGRQTAKLQNPIQKWVTENQKFIKQFLRAVQDWPERERESLKRLADHGWYLDPEMPFTAPAELAQVLDGGHLEDFTAAISKFFRNRVDGIEQRLKRQFPHRESILEDAFYAHREGKYNLSVPILLVQADGIWWDKFSRNIFINRDRNDSINSYMYEIRDTYNEVFFDVIKSTIPLWMTASERSPSFDQLNRHLVLHGEVVNYGTEQNSLKAISFLSWLCWILSEAGEDAP